MFAHQGFNLYRNSFLFTGSAFLGGNTRDKCGAFTQPDEHWRHYKADGSYHEHSEQDQVNIISTCI